MNRFLLGALAMGAVFALSSFAFHKASAPTRTTTPLKLSDLTLDRVFRQTVVFNASNNDMITVTAPPVAGFVLRTLRLHGGAGFMRDIAVTVNGAPAAQVFLLSSNYTEELDPPIVVRPGDSVTITSQSGASTVTIGGYSTLPGET